MAYDGVVGHFKFAIINASGTRTYWSNDESSADGAEPKNSVKVAFPGKDGVFQIYLGSGLMQPIEPDSFNDPNTFLRVWFSSDDSNFEQLKPNERFSTVPYALRASVAGALDSKSLKQTQLSDDFSGLTLVSEDPSAIGLNRWASHGSVNFHPARGSTSVRSLRHSLSPVTQA